MAKPQMAKPQMAKPQMAKPPLPFLRRYKPEECDILQCVIEI